MATATYIFAIAGLFILPSCLHIFPKFFTKIRSNQLYDRLFRYFLFLLMFITQFWFYLHRLYLSHPHYPLYKDWIQYFWLEFCNFSAFTVMILLLIPNKLFLDSTLMMGLIGPVATVFFPQNLQTETFANFWYWQDMFGHITIFFSYYYLYTYGHTKTKVDKTFIKRSIIYTSLVGLSTEIFNLAFNQNFLFKEVATAIDSSLNKEWEYFLFVVSWVWPVLFIIFYGLLRFFKPIYSYEENLKIEDSWMEKLYYLITKTKWIL